MSRRPLFVRVVLVLIAFVALAALVGGAFRFGMGRGYEVGYLQGAKDAPSLADGATPAPDAQAWGRMPHHGMMSHRGMVSGGGGMPHGAMMGFRGGLGGFLMMPLLFFGVLFLGILVLRPFFWHRRGWRGGVHGDWERPYPKHGPGAADATPPAAAPAEEVHSPTNS